MSADTTHGSDHLTRTAEHTRKQVVSLATVKRIQNESNTVKSLTLRIQDERLMFKAGQWLDVFIPGVDTVGGFSMCSSPCKLATCRELDLAIKYSTHPPAHWVHTQCREGSQLMVRVGGDFYFDPESHSSLDLLLIAGGVGINPLISILKHVADLSGKGDDSQNTTGRVMLLYSSSTADELVFKDQIDAMVDGDERIGCHYFATKEQALSAPAVDSIVRGRRICMRDLSASFDWLRKERTIAYICGPSGMLTDITDMLVSIGIDRGSIRFEKWW